MDSSQTNSTIIAEDHAISIPLMILLKYYSANYD